VIVVKVVGGITLPDICDTIMFDLVVVVGIRKHERNVTAKSEVLFVSELG
jgi:hypothetical protein